MPNIRMNHINISWNLNGEKHKIIPDSLFRRFQRAKLQSSGSVPVYKLVDLFFKFNSISI